MANASDSVTNQSTRDLLGTRIVLWSTVALSILAFIVIAAGVAVTYASGGTNEAAVETSRLVFAALLPLFGTWVGTVLAFYFSKENFKAANDATREIVQAAGLRLTETSIKQAMIPRMAVIGPLSAPNDKLEDIKLAEIEAAFQNKLPSGRRITRVLVLDAKNLCLGIIHRSVWNETYRTGQTASPAVNFNTGTLNDVLGLTSDTDPRKTYKDIVGGVAYVPFDGTLADAKSRMEAVDGCQDVIVTEHGQASEPMLGWITNVEIGKVSRA